MWSHVERAAYITVRGGLQCILLGLLYFARFKVKRFKLGNITDSQRARPVAIDSPDRGALTFAGFDSYSFAVRESAHYTNRFENECTMLSCGVLRVNESRTLSRV